MATLAQINGYKWYPNTRHGNETECGNPTTVDWIENSQVDITICFVTICWTNRRSRTTPTTHFYRIDAHFCCCIQLKWRILFAFLCFPWNYFCGHLIVAKAILKITLAWRPHGYNGKFIHMTFASLGLLRDSKSSVYLHNVIAVVVVRCFH